MSSSWSSSMVGVNIGVGDATSTCMQKGILCGRGDTSMSSVVGPGDDEGRGGVVTKSGPRSALRCAIETRVVLGGDLRLLSIPLIMLAVKSARRGVGKWGLRGVEG